MKIKVRFKDGDKVQVKEQEIAAKDHLEAQIKYPSRVFKNKKKELPRKAKYKKHYDD